MNEIEKLYETAGIKFHTSKEITYYCPFTAEKQIELLKYLGKVDWLEPIEFHFNILGYWEFYTTNVTEFANEKHIVYQVIENEFDIALAKLIKHLWQDLTETEREQIRKILKG